MKKHLLILASLVLGIGQLFAENVTFSVSDLKATLPSNNTNIAIPYAWKVSPYHVTATIAKQDGTEASLGVSTVIGLTSAYKVTVSVAGAGTLNSIKFTTNPSGNTANATASTGTYANGTWTPAEDTNSVTFTCTGTFRLTQIAVEYTPDPNYNPDEPSDGPIEATPIDNLSTYTGNDPYVYDQKTLKYYALNSLGEYEEYGVFTEVNTLAVASAGVTEVEYIATNGTMGTKPYINTGYVHKANTRIVMECNIDGSNNANYQAPFGSRAGYGNQMFVFFWRFAGHNRGCFARNAEVSGEEGMEVPTGEKIKVDASGLTLNVYKDGVTEPSVTITDGGESKGGSTPMYIFDLCHADHADGSATFMKLYTFKIYEGETLVMDLVPIVNGEGKGGLKDKLTGNIYYSANSGNFELPEGAGTEAGIPVYEGKMVIYNGHQYEYTNGSFVDRGALTYAPVAEIGTDYRNLSNWSYPGSNYDSTFGVNVFDPTTGSNTLNPYEGNNGWEPLSFKLTGLTKGETYRASFTYSGTAWYSWSSYTVLPFFVIDGENMPGNAFNNPDEALGYIALPNTETTNQPYATTFVANHAYALLCIQFGVCDDGSHDPAFAFTFTDIKVEKQVYPAAYREITWADPVKYTPLEYIEATSQARANTYTLPYTPVTATQIDAKFQVYDTSTGWCGIFSARNIYAGTGISLYMNGNDRAHFGYFTGGTTGNGDNFAPFSLNTDYEVTADVTKLVVNGEEYTTGNTVTNTTTRQLSLFANPEWDNPMRGRFYYCKISEAGETIYNFKPVMRHDGKFGFYDKANRVFVLPAQGTLEGYGYQKLDDEAYVTYDAETRIVMVGSTAQFLPDVQNLDAATFTWTSADESIATVAGDGTVTGVAAGKVMITVTTEADGGWTASYELTVSEPVFVRHDVNNVGYAVVTGGNGWYSEGNYDFRVNNLVDNDASTNFGCSGVDEAWAIIIASEPVAVQQYSIVTGYDNYEYPYQNPASWKLEGSNDNQNWTLIDEKVQTYQLQAKNLEEFVFPVNGTETYKFFKFTATQLAGDLELGEFWINEQAHTWGDAVETAATCTAPGQKTWTCADCGALKTEVIPVAEHTYENGVCSVCSAKATEVVLLPTRGDNNTPYYAKFRHTNEVSDAEYVDIEEGWNTADFDDSDWDELMMPLGSFGPYHTRWFGDYNTFWFRRTFNVSNPAEFAKLILRVTHDDDCAVFINGEMVWSEFNWTGGENDWRVIDVDPSVLVEGKNVLAMYIEQNWGGAYCDFGLEAQLGATVEVGEAGYATFVAPCDVDFTGADVTPNAATVNGKYVKLTPVTTVPAGTAVVVQAEEGTYTVPKTTDAVLGADNELIAAEEDVVADGSQYILAKPAGAEVGFYHVIEGTTIAAGKGYLVITESPAKEFYGFDPDDATGINGIDIAGENGPIYNVAGQRLQKMQKGVNIINSKKVLK